MNYSHKWPGRLCTALAVLGLSGVLYASDIYIEPAKPVRVIGPLIRPYQKRFISPVNLSDTPRLDSLIHAGNLYLTVQDLLALVLENNIDIEIQRYGPFIAREVLRRAEGGGFLRNFNTPILPGPVSVSLAGVSVTGNGLAAGGGIGAGGVIITQLGPTPPNLDPTMFAYANFLHATSPLSNTILNGTAYLVNNSRQFQMGFQKSWLTGTNASLAYGSNRSLVNSPRNLLNPATNGFLDLTITQNLLQGFGRAVNSRNIRVAKNNEKVFDLQLEQQVITTVSAVLNLYYDLVSFNEDVKIKQQALDIAKKFYEDNKQQVALGTLPSIEVTRSQAEVSARQEDLLIAQTNVAQQETVLKNTLSRKGMANPMLDEVHIVPLDRIQIPPTEEVRPVQDLVQEALANRPEIQQAKLNIQSTMINLVGTKNGLKPTLQAFTEFTNNGLTGPVNPLYAGESPDPFIVGGYGNLLGQLFRRNFPNYSAGFSLNIPFRNRAAQADYVSEQLNLRQNQLQLQRQVNQVRVDVRNAVIGLQQARSRYDAAVATRVLGQQGLEAEQSKYQFGVSSTALVVQAQRDLATDQSAEVQAMANYTHARVAFDQAIGNTLKSNHISIDEAIAGRVARQSLLPDSVLNQPK